MTRDRLNIFSDIKRGGIFLKCIVLSKPCKMSDILVLMLQMVSYNLSTNLYRFAVWGEFLLNYKEYLQY